MAFTEPQQIRQLLDEKKHILITFRKDAGNDVIASALALLLFLEKLGKPVDVVSDGFHLPKALGFLKKSGSILPAFSHLQRFIISLDVKTTGLEELSYDLKDEKLRIFVTPKHGFLTRDQVRTAQTDFKYDLIFILGTQDLESLGGLYDNNTELFYKTPLVNIDREAGNEHFGQINVVDLTATSTAEVLLTLMKQLGEEHIDASIATALLTSMIAKTHSFKTDNVKPHTLATASALITLGANREDIVHHLYRTRSIATLKLWGTVLTHLATDASVGLAWSTITRDDFTRSGAHETDLKDIIEELISNSPEAKVILLLHEEGRENHLPTVHLALHTNAGANARELGALYGAKGTERDVSTMVTGKTLKQVEEEMLGFLRTTLKKGTR